MAKASKGHKDGAKASGKKDGAKKGKRARLDLEARLAALSPDHADIPPAIPVRVAILEAERLYPRAAKLRSKLVKLPGFDATDLDGLPELTLALERAEKRWQKARAEKLAASLKDVRLEAETLRGQIMASARYLLRKSTEAMHELDHIADGDTVADLVADLGQLVDLAGRHPAEWELEVTLPAGSLRRATQLAAALKHTTDDESTLETHRQRNQVSWLLEHAVSEVRAGARYLLHNEPKRLAPFLSQFTRNKSRRHEHRVPPPGPTPVGAKVG